MERLEPPEHVEKLPLAATGKSSPSGSVEVGNSAPGANFTYDACDIVWRRLTLKGVHNYDARHLQAGVDLLAMTREKFPFEDIVTHRVKLEETHHAQSNMG